MRRILLSGLLCLAIGAVVDVGLSLLGHYGVWIFSSDLKTNMFVVAVLYSAVAFFSNASTNEFDRGMTVISSVTKYSVQSHDEVNKKTHNLFFFLAIALVFGLLYYVLPSIKL